ncbi:MULTISPECIES: lipase family protein [unclassified Pseudoalteromonas]|uniref:lipase family protein n=1 Tax=unclassified Pseudoalteromonas TaxID=194690 RepID=UPI000568D3A8|nr:lipase family protein [Pseudoalteromonas sp. A2]
MEKVQAVLPPSIAASVAARVYDIRTSTSFNGDFNPTFIKNFKITNNQIKGVSGGLINQLLNRTTGFALTAQGISPQFEGHHIIGIRGTVFTSCADWLTNLNVAITHGPKNLEVHSGFEKAFTSMKPMFASYVKQHKPKCLHLVGHSLGGAIAQLSAIWASEQGIPTNLYTFGAPRVVLNHSVHSAAHNVGQYRVTHGADPVPCVPAWPFSHTSNEYQTAMNEGSFFNIGAHSMEEDTPGYVNTVAAYKDYGSMESSLKTLHYNHTVLNYALRYNVTFSLRWQRIITDGLITFLKKTGQYAFISAQAGLSVGLTFYDILARCLHESVVKFVELTEELKGLIGHMLAFVGKASYEVVELTTQFIRWVLGLMIKKLYMVAKQAIDRI